ncbi:MAG TPA: hypothetical protein VL793_07040 [Patescibacteria group bacterium]|nr:hypothetical protein [Patescibacteria group bacterium]
MVVLEKSPKFAPSEQAADLRVERTDIEFDQLDPDRVRIRVTVSNAGAERSSVTPIRLESAPLGAFVDWQPLARLLVPALEPGESRELSLQVSRPRPEPLGSFDRLPPKKILSALNTPDQSSGQPGNRFLAITNLLRRAQPGKGLDRNPASRTMLAPDLWDFVGKHQPYWAGNINVFVGNHSVERHMARALRIYPGRTNMAMFMVGSYRQSDAYQFDLTGSASDWNARLYDMTNQQRLVAKTANTAIESGEWVEAAGGLLVVLAVEPPANCREGNLEVQVTRRSTGKTAMVEFNLDPAAQGAGCYYA